MLIGIAIAYQYATGVPNIVKVIKLFMRGKPHTSIGSDPRRSYAITDRVRIRTHLLKNVNSFILRNNVHSCMVSGMVG